ncbi:hypothetical protein [Brevundimonas sp.]|uniref:hypothetical protein n=1 Tax=Brevundimonas sp. TaxID=1871086 RepID=UPI00391A595B
MRVLPTLAVTLAATLAACASTGGGETYQQAYDALNATCQERGGILTPLAGAHTGRPNTDYACEIRGGGGRLGND